MSPKPKETQMPEQAVLEADVVEEPRATELVPTGGVALLGPDDAAAMKRASALANDLKRFVESQDLVKSIGNSDHLEVGAWQWIGGVLNVRPITGDPERVILEDPTDNTYDIGYVCKTVLHDINGNPIGSGTGRCFRSEENWEDAEEYAIASMSETRSIGKAFRNSFGFIAKAAGFDPTPAEEMSGVPAAAQRGHAGAGRRQKRSGGSAPQPTRSAPKASNSKDQGAPAKRRNGGGSSASESQQRLIHVRWKQADGREKPQDDDGTPMYLRAVVHWVTGQGQISEIPKKQVDDVLEAIADWEANIDAILGAANDEDAPHGAEAREIVAAYLED